MESALKGLFGGGDGATATAQAQDFINRYEQGDPTQGYSHEEAQAAFQHAIQNAPPDTIQRAAQQAVGRLNAEQRAEFGQMLQQRQAGVTNPGGLDDVLSGVLGGGGGSLGGLLGGLMGGGAATGAVSQNQGSNGGLGDIMRSPVGKAVIAGIGAYAMKEILGARH
jgi:hypothetical protein